MPSFPEKDVRRLRNAAEASLRQLDRFRERRMDLLREFVGFNYADNGAQDHVPINFMELAVTIYLRNLVSRNPAALAIAHAPSLKAEAKTLEQDLNETIDEMNLERTLRRWVLDAMFGMGVAWVGLEHMGTTEIDGKDVPLTRVASDVVDLDHWCHDMSARRIDRAAYMGHRYEVQLDALKDADVYDEGAVRLLRPITDYPVQFRGVETASSISRQMSWTGDDDRYEDVVRLWDFFLPHDGLLVTLADWEGDSHPLERAVRVAEWDGPRDGPYITLGFEEVSSNSMPVPPAAQWKDLHLLANVLFNKLGRQAERQKDILLAPFGTEKAAQTVINAGDGEVVGVQNTTGITPAKFGGPDPGTNAFLIQIRDLFSWFGGNLDAIGGLSPQSPTLGQDQLLSQSASRRLADMQASVFDGTRRIVRAIAYHRFSDPLASRDMRRRIDALGIEIPVTFRSWEIKGAFLDFNFDIEPYSMTNLSPSQRVQAITQLLMQTAIPLAPLLAQQGVSIDLAEFYRLVARYLNIPELDSILKQQAIAPEDLQSPQRLNAPATSVRTEERISRPAATRTGFDQVMQQLLSGAQVQPAQGVVIGKSAA